MRRSTISPLSVRMQIEEPSESYFALHPPDLTPEKPLLM